MKRPGYRYRAPSPFPYSPGFDCADSFTSLRIPRPPSNPDWTPAHRSCRKGVLSGTGAGCAGSKLCMPARRFRYIYATPEDVFQNQLLRDRAAPEHFDAGQSLAVVGHQQPLRNDRLDGTGQLRQQSLCSAGGNIVMMRSMWSGEHWRYARWENTWWPVSAACSAIRRVSTSRSSPMRITSGSCRSA